jgi:hypothetical protein
MAEETQPPRRPGPRSRGELLDHWNALAVNLTNHLDDLPHAAPDLTTFQATLQRIQMSVAESQLLEARKVDLVRIRKEDMRLARDLRNRLVAQVQGKLGTASEMLREFGVKPRKRRFRRKPQEEPASEPAPAAIKIT